jgi:hypothetical protein
MLTKELFLPCAHAVKWFCPCVFKTDLRLCPTYLPQQPDFLPVLERAKNVLLFKLQCLAEGQQDYKKELEIRVDVFDKIIDYMKRKTGQK